VKRVVVTGATGLIGGALCARLAACGDTVVVFSRDPARARRTVRGARDYVAWRAGLDGPWREAIEGVDAIVNLAGAPIAGWPVIGPRWTEGYKRQIRDSRVLGTRGLGGDRAERPPALRPRERLRRGVLRPTRRHAPGRECRSRR
jgi:NAD dependent epimerase/dehydratase family enzyme